MKWIKVVLATVALFMTLMVPQAAASTLMDNMVPEDEEQQEADYNKYPQSRYNMDTYIEESKFSDWMPWGIDDGINKTLSGGMDLLVDLLWTLNRFFSNLTVWLVGDAFQLDLVTPIIDEISGAIQTIAGFGPGGMASHGLFPYFLTFMICILIVWSLYVGVVKNATSAAWSGMLSSLIVLVLAFGFFSNAKEILTGMNDFSSDVQTDMLNLTNGFANGELGRQEDGVTAVKNQVFYLLVYHPYLLMQYGTFDEEEIEAGDNKSGNRIDRLLKHGVFSEERAKEVEYEATELDNDMMQPEALTDRFIFLLLLLIGNAILGCTMLLLALSTIAFGLLFIIYACMLPIAFLMALVPAWNYNVWQLLGKMLHALLMKIAIGILLTLMFMISTFLFNAFGPQYGWPVMIIVQIIAWITIWIKRNEIFSVITAPAKGLGNTKLGQNISQYKSAYHKTRKNISKAVAPITKKSAPLAERMGINELKKRPGIGAVHSDQHTMLGHSFDRGDLKKKKLKTSAAPSTGQKTTQTVVERPQKENINKESSAPMQKNISTKTPQSNKIPQEYTTRPDYNENENTKNLAETTEKGGWAYDDNQKIKNKPQLVDRMEKRKAENGGNDNG